MVIEQSSTHVQEALAANLRRLRIDAWFPIDVPHVFETCSQPAHLLLLLAQAPR